MVAVTMTKTKLKDVCDRITVGHVGPMADKYTPDGVPFLRSQNITPFRLHLEDIKFVPRDFHELLRKSALRPGDVAVVRTGYPGTACVIPETLPESNCADLVVITPSKNLNPYFLAAIFNSAWGKSSVAGNLVGVAQQHFNVGAAKEMEVTIPSRAMQDRIAGILSAYDDLSENTLWRIRILEEMAHALYREWFVNFRFPGHEAVDFVETQFGRAPEGWVLPFIDHVDFKEGPGLRNWQYRNEGLPFLNIRTLVDNDIDLSKVQFLDPKEVEEKYQHFLLREHDHVVSSSGTIGRIVTIRAEHLPLMLNTSIIRMRPHGQSIGCWQLKHFLLHDYFQNQAKSFATGAAQANFGPIHLKQMQIIAPGEHIAAEYERLVAPMEFAIMSLARRNQNLRRTRDLLLPRLLSGEVSLAIATAKPIENVA